MGDVETLNTLLDRIRDADRADIVLDAYIVCAALAPAGSFVSRGPIFGDVRICTGQREDGRDIVWSESLAWLTPRHRVTQHLSSARSLAERALPNFWFSSGLCSLSGHASAGPDYNGPHSEALKAAWPEERFHAGFDADLSPGDGEHRECLAVIDVVLQALIAQAEQGASHGVR